MSIRDVFRSVDTENKGYVEKAQVGRLLQALDPEASVSQNDVLFVLNEVELSAGDRLSFVEFRKWYNRARKVRAAPTCCVAMHGRGTAAMHPVPGGSHTLHLLRGGTFSGSQRFQVQQAPGEGSCGQGPHKQLRLAKQAVHFRIRHSP